MRKTAEILLATVCGGWMVFDGVHVLAVGKYFGPDKPGPWSDLVSALGVDPFALGPVFIGLGLLWLAFAVGAALKRADARQLGLLASALTLWYLPFGTLVALIVLVLLIGRRKAAAK